MADAESLAKQLVKVATGTNNGVFEENIGRRIISSYQSTLVFFCIYDHVSAIYVLEFMGDDDDDDDDNTFRNNN